MKIKSGNFQVIGKYLYKMLDTITNTIKPEKSIEIYGKHIGMLPNYDKQELKHPSPYAGEYYITIIILQGKT